MKLYSWNVNGIRAVLNKGEFQKFIAAHDPDILCLQETKANRDQVEVDFEQYHEHFFGAVRKGYSGTAIPVSYTHLDVYKRQHHGRCPSSGPSVRRPSA